MKKIVLKKLNIENFKGIKKLEINFNSDHNEILGNNYVGKSSIYDAYMFLLHGTDSLHSAKFNVLPTIENGRIRQASVEAIFNISDPLEIKDISLKRVYKTKKGDLDRTKEASASITTFYVNDKKVTKTQYLIEINNILDKDRWQILSNPQYFFTHLSKQEQRNLVLNIIGDISREEVINAAPQLSRIEEICGSKDTLEQRQILVKKKTILNKDLEENPTRINELLEILGKHSDIESIDSDDVKKELKDVKNSIQDLNAQIASASVDNAQSQAILVHKKEMNEIQEKIEIQKASQRQTRSKILEKEQNKIELLNKTIWDKRQEKNQKQRKLTSIEVEITDKNQSIDSEIIHSKQNLQNYKTKFEKLQLSKNGTYGLCFNCGQKLPDHMLEEIESKYQDQLKNIKENVLKITTKIKALQSSKLELDSHDSEYNLEIETLKEEIKSLESQIKDCTNEKNQIEGSMNDKATKSEIPFKEEISRLTAEKEEIYNQIEKIRKPASNANDAVKTLNQELTHLGKRQDELYSSLNTIEYVKDIKGRIKKLNNQQLDIANKYQSVLKDIDLIDEFHNLQAKLLEDKINHKLSFGEIKLFEPLVQGGLQATCVLMHNDVDYFSLNYAAKINAGLALIDVISKETNVQVPVWVDGAESIQNFIKMNTQLITMRVINEKSYVALPEGKELMINQENKGPVLWDQVLWFNE